MTVRCLDWRRLRPDRIRPLLSAEAAAHGRLGWDVADAWTALEPARAAGRLPGIVVQADGRIRGWACFLVHRDALQVGMVVSDGREATEALVDAILASPDARAPHVALWTVFARAAAPGLEAALAERGFGVAASRYRTIVPHRALHGAGEPVAHGLRAWSARDRDALVELAADAYADEEGVRVFAPRGRRDEWRDYVHSLLASTACGCFRSDLSFVADAPGEGALDAAILTTDLGPDTAHAAQVVVRPAARGRGLGRRLLSAVAGATAAAGYARLTLLVSDDSRRASALYDRFGFDVGETFVAAIRSAAFVHEGRGAAGRDEHAPVGGERRFAAFKAGHGAAARQLGVGERRQ